LSLDQADDGLPVVLADDGICLPVADTTSSIDNSRTLLNGLAVGDDAAPICLAARALMAFRSTALLCACLGR
ncbi:hypothetical protein SAMN05421510_11015, partial [Nitrosomonas ureae]